MTLKWQVQHHPARQKTPLQLSRSGDRCIFHYSRVWTQIWTQTVCSDEDKLFLASYIICCRVFASSQANIGQFLSSQSAPLLSPSLPPSSPKQLSLGPKKDPINKAHVFKDTFQWVYMSMSNVRHTCIRTKLFFIIWIILEPGILSKRKKEKKCSLEPARVGA